MVPYMVSLDIVAGCSAKAFFSKCVLIWKLWDAMQATHDLAEDSISNIISRHIAVSTSDCPIMFAHVCSISLATKGDFTSSAQPHKRVMSDIN